MEFYDVTIYNDSSEGACNKITYHGFKAEDKDLARAFGEGEAKRLFLGLRTSVHVAWVMAQGSTPVVEGPSYHFDD